MELTLDTHTQTLFQELDYREANGIEVSLLWNPNDNTVTVYVCDTHTNETFELNVARTDARQAFQHPYAYAAARYNEPAPADQHPSPPARHTT